MPGENGQPLVEFMPQPGDFPIILRNRLLLPRMCHCRQESNQCNEACQQDPLAPAVLYERQVMLQCRR